MICCSNPFLNQTGFVEQLESNLTEKVHNILTKKIQILHSSQGSQADVERFFGESLVCLSYY